MTDLAEELVDYKALSTNFYACLSDLTERIEDLETHVGVQPNGDIGPSLVERVSSAIGGDFMYEDEATDVISEVVAWLRQRRHAKAACQGIAMSLEDEMDEPSV